MSGPTILSAYLELVDAPVLKHGIMDCKPGNGDPNALIDSMAVTFSKPMDGLKLAPEMFRIMVTDPELSLNQIVHPDCVSLAPTDDSNTVLMVGEFASHSGGKFYGPTKVEVDFDNSGDALVSIDVDETTGLHTDPVRLGHGKGIKTSRRLQTDCACDEACVALELSLVTDSWPGESSFFLANVVSATTVWIETELDKADHTETYTTTVCPSGCHNFRIQDSYGDGIISPGGYQLYLDGDLISQGENFGFFHEVPVGSGCSDVEFEFDEFFVLEDNTTDTPTDDEDPDEDDGDFWDDIKDFFTSCFSGNMEVLVQGKGTVAMEALQVGDYVKIGIDETYEQVYAFAHHDPQRHAEFVQLHTNAGTPLELTGEHLVFVDGKTNPVRADSIKVGDILHAEKKNAVVEKVTSVTRNGIYSPLTSSGTIQVNGITASNYVSLQKESNEYVELQGDIEIMSHHDFAHRAMSPFWLYCTTFGVCDISDSNSGLPVYISNGIKLIQWSLQQHIALQLLLWASFRMLILLSILMMCAVLMIPASMISGSSIYHLQRLMSDTCMFGAHMNKNMNLKKEN